MKTKELLKAIQPHAIFITLGFLLVMAFFHPLFIENKSMNQNDIFQGVVQDKKLPILDRRQEKKPYGPIVCSVVCQPI